MAENKKPKVGKVVTGKVTETKQSEGKKFIKSFVEEDAHNIGEYLRDDILIPTFKDLLSNVVTNSIEMLLYGETRPSGRDRGRSRAGHVRYDNMYRGSRYRDDRDDYVRPRNRYDVREYEFESRADADLVLRALDDHLDEYGDVSVGDYYSACDKSPEWTDFNFGWYDLSGARIERSRRAWVIRFPRPIDLGR